jgi:HlyD family secretion protein
MSRKSIERESVSKMPKADSTMTTFLVAVLIAAGVLFGIQLVGGDTSSSPANAARNGSFQVAQATGATTESAPRSQWAATAAGRVEPRGGEIGITPEVGGVVTQTLVEVGDKVKAGDLLFTLRDDELRARWEMARTEVDVRKRERSEDPSVEEDQKKADLAKPRLAAEDAVGDAELAVYAAQRAFDAAYIAMKSADGPAEAVDAAREELAKAKSELEAKRTELADVRAGENVPLPTRMEGGLESARDELRLIEIALERTRVRAPTDGTILSLDTQVGEAVAPSPLRPVIRMGDTEKLTIRSELEERDISAIGKGQSVIVRSNAFPGRDFTGKVTWIAPSLGAPKLSGRGPRQLADVDVIELTIDLDDTPPLLPGMRVDVFFKPMEQKQAARG